MTLAGYTFPRHWLVAATAALGLHLGVILATVFGVIGDLSAEPPDPVVLVELPPLQETLTKDPSEPAAAVEPPPSQAALPAEPALPALSLPVTAPRLSQPLPRVPVEVAERSVSPSPQPEPAREPASVPTPAPASEADSRPAATPPDAAPGAGGDRRAKDQEAAWYGLISTHLNRKKKYPVEAKKAGQKGIVLVRFTIDRNGNVSATSIRKGSGHQLLDQATLDLMQRVSPLPRMPASMTVERVTLSLPIDYSLTSN